jgi:hypothetical protein
MGRSTDNERGWRVGGRMMVGNIQCHCAKPWWKMNICTWNELDLLSRKN